MSNTATRLITLIFLLQNRPSQKASELADQLGVSLRTIHRYFVMLDDMGIPVYSERGPHGGFSLVRGFKMPPLVFTLEEAVAVVLGTGIVLSDSTFSQPAGFNMQAYLKNELQAQPQVTARLRFEAQAAHIPGANRSYWNTMEPRLDGSVEALEPAELRALVIEWLETAAGKYRHEQ